MIKYIYISLYSPINRLYCLGQCTLFHRELFSHVAPLQIVSLLLLKQTYVDVKRSILPPEFDDLDLCSEILWLHRPDPPWTKTTGNFFAFNVRQVKTWGAVSPPAVAATIKQQQTYLCWLFPRAVFKACFHRFPPPEWFCYVSWQR